MFSNQMHDIKNNDRMGKKCIYKSSSSQNTKRKKKKKTKKNNNNKQTKRKQKYQGIPLNSEKHASVQIKKHTTTTTKNKNK